MRVHTALCLLTLAAGGGAERAVVDVRAHWRKDYRQCDVVETPYEVKWERTFNCSGTNTSAAYAVYGATRGDGHPYKLRACRRVRGWADVCSSWFQHDTGHVHKFVSYLTPAFHEIFARYGWSLRDHSEDIILQVVSDYKQTISIAVWFEPYDAFEGVQTSPPATRTAVQECAAADDITFWAHYDYVCAGTDGTRPYVVTGALRSKNNDHHSLRVCRARYRDGVCDMTDNRYVSCSPEFLFEGDAPESFSIAVLPSSWADDCVLLDVRNMNLLESATFGVDSLFFSVFALAHRNVPDPVAAAPSAVSVAVGSDTAAPVGSFESGLGFALAAVALMAAAIYGATRRLRDASDVSKSSPVLRRLNHHQEMYGTWTGDS